ncbi:MAG: DUF1822 family protein [Cyanobacteria bacterium J06649_4]
MFSFLDQTQSDVSLLSTTVVDLDEQQHQQAKALSEAKGGTEVEQWQAYLTLLGQLAFCAWFSEYQSDESLTFSENETGLVQIGEFRVRVLVVEHCLSEQVSIPVQVIDDPEKAAHFYMLLEVTEEQSDVWLRGLIRRDRLSKRQQTQTQQQESTDGQDAIVVPLSAFKPEPSRLLHYCRHLEPAAIPLPQIATIATASPASTAPLSAAVVTIRTRLSEWLETTTNHRGWQAWDLLQPQLAYATRGLSDGIKRGKLVTIGLDVGEVTVALVLTLISEVDGRISILVQLLPIGRDRTLPPQIALALVSKKGKSLQSVTSRNQDNYIQLKSFKGMVGQRFGIQIQHQSVTILEDFEI